jgi:hypothetical protein
MHLMDPFLVDVVSAGREVTARMKQVIRKGITKKETRYCKQQMD